MAPNVLSFLAPAVVYAAEQKRSFRASQIRGFGQQNSGDACHRVATQASWSAKTSQQNTQEIEAWCKAQCVTINWNLSFFCV